LAHPIEGWTEVVDELLAGIRGSDLSGKAGGFLDAGVAGLEPKKVGVGGEFDGSLGGCWQAGAVVVETFSCSGEVPAEKYGNVAVLVR